MRISQCWWWYQQQLQSVGLQFHLETAQLLAQDIHISLNQLSYRTELMFMVGLSETVRRCIKLQIESALCGHPFDGATSGVFCAVRQIAEQRRCPCAYCTSDCSLRRYSLLAVSGIMFLCPTMRRRPRGYLGGHSINIISRSCALLSVDVP